MTKLLPLLLFSTMAVGCTEATDPGQVDFGTHYRIEVAPDPPLLQDTGLSVTLSYGACGGDRQFALEYRTNGSDAADVWLRKVTPDEPCDMLVTERRSFLVPDAVDERAIVTLLAPGDESFALRP